LELNYWSNCSIVLIYSWIPTDLDETNSKVVKDKYGFALGNFQTTLSLERISFVFPIQCHQVFFLDDPFYNGGTNGDWEVICGTDVRSHYGDATSSTSDIKILNVGRDSDFWGLRVVEPEVASSTCIGFVILVEVAILRIQKLVFLT
jgi:hypothetical protein